MKTWGNPDLWVLGADKTAGGGGGPPADGVWYQVGNDQLQGGYGPDLNLPIAIRN